jgi:hypothetical protein
MPADDSSFPLDPATLLKGMEDGVGGRFRGDGFEFMINAIPTSAPGPFPQAEKATLDHMITSIHFEPWSTGETRGDWTAVGKVLPSASAEWVTFQGDHYVAVYGSPRALLGPAPVCPGGATYEIRETGVAAITCSNGTSAAWDFTSGGANGNTGFGSSDLPSHPAALGWDGQLLVRFGGVQPSAIPTLSPIPASSSP